MAHERHEFDLDGEYYESFGQCLRLSGKSREYIYEHRKNVRRIKCVPDIVIDHDRRKKKAVEQKTQESIQRRLSRWGVEDHMTKKSLDILSSDEAYFEELLNEG